MLNKKIPLWYLFVCIGISIFIVALIGVETVHFRDLAKHYYHAQHDTLVIVSKNDTILDWAAHNNRVEVTEIRPAKLFENKSIDTIWVNTTFIVAFGMSWWESDMDSTQNVVYGPIKGINVPSRKVVLPITIYGTHPNVH